MDIINVGQRLFDYGKQGKFPPRAIVRGVDDAFGAKIIAEYPRELCDLSKLGAQSPGAAELIAAQAIIAAAQSAPINAVGSLPPAGEDDPFGFRSAAHSDAPELPPLAPQS